MNNPTSFETSWTEAERSVFDAIALATGTVEGRDAYLGGNPGIANVWHLGTLPLDRGDEVLFLAAPESMCVPVYAECAYLKRSDCQLWAMRILGGLPYSGGNVATARVRGVGEIKGVTAEFKNEKKPLIVWTLRIEIDIAFSTGGAGNRTMGG